MFIVSKTSVQNLQEIMILSVEQGMVPTVLFYVYHSLVTSCEMYGKKYMVFQFQHIHASVHTCIGATKKEASQRKVTLSALYLHT